MSRNENSAYALEQLRLFLSTSARTAGARLPTERELSARFGLTRTAIRRALDVLEAEGRIWRRQGAGTFVGPGDQRSLSASDLILSTDFVEIMEVRLRIEPQIAHMAALRARGADIVRMRDLANRIAESTDADARELWDGALHRLFAEAARNSLLLSIFDIVNRVRQDDAWRSIRERVRTDRTSLPVTGRQHHDIIDAIAARDPALAADRMHQHILLLQDMLIHQVRTDQSAQPPQNVEISI
ncbi:FadR/GntR family transcriptional regulator [Falsirhodobacter halotolerans]|uniref:FadR/GntR family transcriptional regulator n=1 Tax=Falsirhodobacter halotolerans TaxID=1146892 RepID=UPI001FD5F576|nr:FCD domain-containing protein [Falsirhodobacter halotolerans]MCJ8140842.1 FCD domain-containing protein [Falsirhodobacter halotolerans]